MLPALHPLPEPRCARASADRAAALDAIRDALAGGDEAVRCHAARALARMGARDRASADALLGALQDPDPDVRADACAAAGRLGLAAAVEPLVDRLEADPAGAVRAEAARALGFIGSDRALDALARCFRAAGYPGVGDPAGDGEHGYAFEVQSRALEALGAIGDPRGAAPVIEALEAGDCEDLQEAAFRVLARLDGAQAAQYLVQQLGAGDRLARRRAARALGAMRGSRRELPAASAAPLLDALLDADAAVRIEAARALSAGGAPGAHVPLMLLLGDSQPEVRAEVVRLLAAAGGAAVVDRLQALLADADPAVRHAAVRALGGIGDARTVALLGALLDTHDEALRLQSIGAIGALGMPGAEAKLAAILADATAQHAVRVQAARSLARVLQHAPERSTFIELLARSALDADERVAQAALCALVDADPAGAAERLVDALAATTAAAATRLLALRLLGGCASPGARGHAALRGACGNDDAAVRREALLALGRAGGAEARALLLAGLDDEAREVRLAALEGLCRRPEPVPDGRLGVLCDDPDTDVRACALQALVGAEGDAAAAWLRRALADERLEVCRTALSLLSGRNAGAGCGEAVLALMFRFSGELRAEAGVALRRLNDSGSSASLLAVLDDPARDGEHWIAIDALAEVYAGETRQ